MGCDNLLVVTDHKPLVKLLSDRSLDEITNPRLFRIKQRTLLWRFDIEHVAGKLQYCADAMSRHPVDEDISEISSTEVFEGLQLGYLQQHADVNVCSNIEDSIHAVTWDRVRLETQKDVNLMNLCEMINSVFPDSKNKMPSPLREYWDNRDRLYTVDGVIMRNDEIVVPLSLRSQMVSDWKDHNSRVRVIIPAALRSEVIDTLHAAHQGISSMNERAKASVYWPGITRDIQRVRESCSSCNRNAPSQVRPPPIAPWIPSSPYEAVVCDYFDYQGWHYFISADRLSGWTETERVHVGSHESGSHGLCNALRRLVSRFGVPFEIASDGGPEFVARETKDFFRKWGVHHRLSSASFPQSNGRAELAVKATKRLLLDNVGPDGTLNTDKFVRAALTQRNTPLPDC